MGTRLSRRSFLKKSALAWPTKAAFNAAAGPDLAVVHGGDYFKSTPVGVDRLSGMGRIIPRGARVGLLINHPFRNPGTHVNPAIALAVIKM